MLIIKNNQTVQEILAELKELSRVKTELRIIIESLPASLDSEIGLDHFLYMLTNYPRQIAWVTDDNYIFSRLELRGFTVQRFNTFSNKTSQTLAEIDRLSGYDQNQNNSKEIDPSSHQSINLENTFTNLGLKKRNLSVNPVFLTRQTAKKSEEHGYGYLQYQNQQKTTVLDLNEPILNPTLKTEKLGSAKTLDFTPQKSNQIKLPVFQTLELQTKPDLSLASPINTAEQDNTQLQLLKPEKVENRFDLVLKSTNSTNDIVKNRPDLDRVRSSIIASQEVLASINQVAKPKNLENFKNSQIAIQKDSFNDLITDQFELISSLQDQTSSTVRDNNQFDPSQSFSKNPIKINLGFWNPLRYVYLFSFALVVILSIVSIALGFPTIAYTIEFAPEKKENQTLFTFEKNFLTQQNYKFDLGSSADTTGTIATDSSRARGKIRLLNKTANNIDLNLSKFYLLSGDNRYNPVYDSTQVQNISIPSKNHLSGPIVEIMVESGSSSNSQNFELNEGTDIRPVNLQGVPLGPNFTAVVSEAITSNKSQSNRTVTDSDLRTLRASIESNLLNEKENKITQIDTAKFVANINWSTNIESVFNADHKLGDGADRVSMTARVSSDLYYLDKKLLVDKILAREPSAERVTKIEISNGETAWNKDDQKLSLDVKYIYSLKNDISKDKLKEIAQNSGLDTTQASSKIKETFPRISEVKAAVTGVPVPFSPRIEVEMVQGGGE